MEKGFIGAKVMPLDGTGFEADERVSQIDGVIHLIGLPHKWVKGKRRTGNGRFCLTGALIELSATRLRPVVLEAILEVTGKRYRLKHSTMMLRRATSSSCAFWAALARA